jgi:hypothetical protein
MASSYIQVNEFDMDVDTQFIENILTHYLSEVYNDLLNREPVENNKKLSFKVFSEVSYSPRSELLSTADCLG